MEISKWIMKAEGYEELKCTALYTAFFWKII